MLKGEINHFYNMWSDNAKKCMQFLDFGRIIAQTIQMHGPFTSIGEPNTPFLMMGTDDFWLMQVPMFIGDVEFFARISKSGLATSSMRAFASTTRRSLSKRIASKGLC